MRPVSTPIIGMAKIAPMPRGLTAHARGESGVAQQFLVEQREQRDEAVNRGAKQADQHASDGEVAVAEDAEIDQRRRDGEFPNDERRRN